MRGRRNAFAAVTAIALLACGSPATVSQAPAPAIDLQQPWASVSASDVGIDPAALTHATADAAAMPRFRALLVARHGKVALEEYFGGTDAETPFDVRSVTKSVVSLLVGQSIAAGQLRSVDATVGEYLKAPYVLDAGDRAVSVRNLLTMTSGYQWDEETGNDYNLWIESPDRVQFLFDRPQVAQPAPFTYNSAAVHVLGVLLQTATATPLPTLAEERLFQPIGVTSASWEKLERGTVNGGSGIKLTGRDLLRLGQLMLQQGRSGSRQIVPADWVAQVTSPQFGWRDNDGPQRSVTYGDLWWVADPPGSAAFFAWGYGGQFVYVVPSLDLVVVTTTEWVDLGADQLTPLGIAESVLGVIVNDILPGVAPE